MKHLTRDLVIGLTAAGLLTVWVMGRDHLSYQTTEVNFEGYSAASAMEPRVDSAPAEVVAANQGVVSVLPIKYKDQWNEVKMAGSAVHLADGLLVTNRHVVQDILKIDPNNKVAIVYGQGANRAVAEAEVLCVSSIATSDFAFLQLTEKVDLPRAKFSYDKPQPGEDIFVLGSRNGVHGNLVDSSVTEAPEVEIPVDYHDQKITYNAEELINTDEDSTRAGNSGGAMVNAAGELEAITFAFESTSGRGMGQPINDLRDWVNQVISDSSQACQGGT